MSQYEPKTINSLERIVDRLDIAVWITVALSVVFGGMLQFYKTRLSALQKDQLVKFELEVKIGKKAAADATIHAEVATKATQEAKIEFEKERTKRLNLQKAIAPREIDADALSNELKEFKGYTVIIEELADLETSLLSQQFRAALKKAGCLMVEGNVMISTRNPFWISVKILGNFNNLDQTDPLARFYLVINNHFIDHNILIETFDLGEEKLPPKTLKMVFGMKPPVKIK